MRRLQEQPLKDCSTLVIDLLFLILYSYFQFQFPQCSKLSILVGWKWSVDLKQTNRILKFQNKSLTYQNRILKLQNKTSQNRILKPQNRTLKSHVKTNLRSTRRWTSYKRARVGVVKKVASDLTSINGTINWRCRTVDQLQSFRLHHDLQNRSCVKKS